ncbi:MAG: hypothetical protein R3Y63_12820 [Eubacteriales bacterium]
MKNNKSNKAFALALISSACTVLAVCNAENLNVFQGFFGILGIVTAICWSRFFALNRKTGDTEECVLDKTKLFVFRITELASMWMVVESGRYYIAILYGLILFCVEYLIYKGTHLTKYQDEK